MVPLQKIAPYFAIRFYELLTEKYGQRGKDIFFVGFHLYCFRKGIRCAQRTLSKGFPLNFESYQLFRETIFRTPEVMADPSAPGRSTRQFIDGETISCNYYCDTHEVFREYDCPEELEELWCRNVDRMMVYSYNPYIGVGYEVTETFCTCDHCEHHCKAPEFRADMTLAKRTEDAPPLTYLTWSAYSSFAEMTVSILGDEGKAIAEQVRQDTIREFGSDLWQQIYQYNGTELDKFMPV